MSFIRPEAQEALWRWREVLVGATLAAFGLWLGWKGIGGQAIIGVLLMVLGIGLAFAGWQRARFRTGRNGAGVVYVTEGQITYYGPYQGGFVAVEEIQSLLLDKTTAPTWIISAPGREALVIPTNAEGAEALFDAFTALPGFDTERMLTALQTSAQQRTPLWQRRTTALH